MHQKTSGSGSSWVSLSRAALVSACALAVAVSLAGCGESPTEAGNRAAQTKSSEATSIVENAGTPRATNALKEEIEGAGSLSAAQANALDISRKLKNGSPDVVKRYVAQRSVTEDLQAAQKALTEALGSGDRSPSPLFKSTVQSQLADVMTAQAQMQLASTTSQYAQLVVQSAEVESMARRVLRVATTAGQAQVRSQESPAELQKELDQAKQSEADAGDRVKKLQQQVDALEQRVKGLRDQAGNIYTQAQKALNAADQASGLNSIDAYKAAVQQRNKADDLTAQAQSLQPDLDVATRSLALAKQQQALAAGSIEQIQQMIKSVQERAQAASAQASKLHDEVQSLIQEPEHGLKGAATRLKNLADALHEKAEAAYKAAKSAQSYYGNAATQFSSYQSSIHEDQFGPGNPLVAASRDRTVESLLKLMQASAAYRAGQAKLLEAMAGRTMAQAANLTAQAYKAADMPSEPALASAADASVAQQAQADFEAALKGAGDADKIMQSAAKGGVSNEEQALVQRLLWLPEGLTAAINSNLYVLTGKDEYLRAANDAAQKAHEANPAVDLSALVQQPVAPAAAQ